MTDNKRKIWKALDGCHVYQLTREADPVYYAEVYKEDGRWTFNVIKRGTEQKWYWKRSVKTLSVAQAKALKCLRLQRQADENTAKLRND